MSISDTVDNVIKGRKAACETSPKVADHNWHTYEQPRLLLALPDEGEAKAYRCTKVCVDCGLRLGEEPKDGQAK